MIPYLHANTASNKAADFISNYSELQRVRGEIRRLAASQGRTRSTDQRRAKGGNLRQVTGDLQRGGPQ